MDVREQIYHIVEQLPEDRLEDALRFVRLLMQDEMEIEDFWLLSSGALKRMVDEIDETPAAAADWRSHLRDL